MAIEAKGAGARGTDSLRGLLDQAFAIPAQQPASTELTPAIAATAYWSFPPNLEVVLATAERPPSDAQARAAFEKRLNRRPIPLVLIVSTPEGATVVGPGASPPPVAALDPRLIVDDLAAAAALDPLEVRQRLPQAFRRAQGAGGLAGVRNQGLFSAHFLRARVPRFAEWPELAEQGRAAARRRGTSARLEALGFAAEEQAAGIFLLRAEGRPAAAVISYPQGQDLDRAREGGELPVATLLSEVEAAGTRWGILAAGEVWRLYDAEHPSRATSFVEVDAGKLAEPAYLAALFSASALGGADPLAARIGEGSAKYGAELGDRLRGRVYQRVVPGLAAALAEAAERAGIDLADRAGLAALYDATLTLLYRLLFVLYAEARDFLPLDSSEGYRAHSLEKRIQGVIATEQEGLAFDGHATDVWSDLQETFHAVAHGQVEWGVPAYNGGLFRDDPDTEPGRILRAVRPTNAGLGPALFRLAVDPDDDEAGRIDYADLDIRRLGDIYEGLLQFELDRAREPLRYDSKLDAFVPAGEEGVPAEVPTGGIYVRTRSGGRKASGSFYTPQFIVRHLVNEALVPRLREHLDEVARIQAQGDEEAAAARLWDFRVCDPAMGSGHFLVDALDVLTGEIARHLSEHPLRPVRTVLAQLREMVLREAGDLPAGAVGELRDVDLLKRVVLKRCIYGVDRNRMAVELAKLGLWLEAFVPGLPLSYLDHNLKQGNSLIGVVGDEVQRALRPEQGTIEGDRIAERLAVATEKARRAVETVELSLRDVKAAEAAEGERAAELVEVRSLYDRWSAESFGLPGARERIGEDDAADAEAAAGPAHEHLFFHWPLEYPELFARARPGFDVVLANPPWEKLKPEKHNIYALYRPGLKGVRSAAERDRIVSEMDAAGSPAAAAHADAIRAYEGVRAAFSRLGDYRLSGTGDLDTFKAFAERFLHVARPGGSVGCVLPRQILAGAGSRALRAAYLREATAEAIDVVENKGRWAFENVHGQYTIVLLAVRNAAASVDGAVPVSGPLKSRRDLAEAPARRANWALSDLERWSETLDVPLFGEPEMGPVFAKMMEQPRFGADVPGSWRALPYAELHGTADRPGLFETEPFEGAWEVWKGGNFDRYRPGMARPAFWADPKKLIERLQQKRLASRRVWGQFPEEVVRESTTLPIHTARIAFRDISRATDSRTMRACLVPPRTACVEMAPTLLWPRGDELDQAWVIGVLSSLPFDWISRRRVENHMKYAILNALPVPRPDSQPSLRQRVVELAARLSCVDDRYADFAAAAGVESGSLSDPGERLDAEAEIDALVAHAYGLDTDDLEVIFRDFTERAVTPEHRDLVRAHHARAAEVARAA